MGASHSNYDTHSSLKNLNTPVIEDKLVEFLNSIGFVSSIDTDNFDSYVSQIKSELSNSDLNDNSIQTAISGIRTYLEDGLSIKTDESPSSTLKNGHDIVKTVNDTVKMHLSRDLDNIKSVIDDSALLSSLLTENKYGGNDKLTENLYNKTVDMVKNNAMILNQLYNSEIINNLKSNIDNNDVRYNDNNDIKTSTLNYIKEIVNTLSNVHNYNEVSKVYNNDSIKLNKDAFDTFKSYYGSMSSDNKNINDDQVKDLLDKLYKSINEPKKTGGGSNFLESIKNEFNSSVNWDSYSTVKDILSQQTSQPYLYSGSSETLKLPEPKIEYEISGSGELQNKLKYTMTMKNAKRNAEMISNADILNDKLSSISTDLISLMPTFKTLNDTQINDLEKIFKKFLYFASFKYKNMFLILLGFYVDLQSIYIKKDFIVKVTHIIELCQKGSVILPKLKSVSEKLTDILTFVSKTSDEYSNKYWLGKETSDRSSTDAYDTRIMIDYDDIPQLNLMNSIISNTVFRIIYSLRLTSYHNQLKTSTDHKNKDYEELVGKSLGYEIDKIKEDYTKIMTKLNELEQTGSSAEFKDDKSIELNYPISVIPVPTPSSTGEVTYTYSEIKRIFMYLPCEPPVDEKTSNKRDHRAWGRNDPDWIDDEFLRGVKPQIEPIRGEKFKSMINNYKQYFINYYESVIGLHMVAQVIDIYLMKFTEKIRKTPDIIEKLDTLLSNSKISSLVHTDKVADYLVDIFDPSHCNKTNNNSSNKDIINDWVNSGKLKTHKSFAYKKEDKFLSPLMFNHYFISSEDSIVDISISDNDSKKITDAGNIPINEIAKFDRESSIINCGAGACDEVRPMVDLIANRIPDNSINRGGLHNSRWSTLPGSLDRLKKVIDYANINDMNLINENDINKNINLTEWENSSHSMGSEYYEKYIIDDSNTRTPIDKLRKLKEYYKNNSTLTNLISLFFSMVQVEDDGNKTLSPKTILDYLLNFMCWGSYTITNTPSTLDINIGNDMPISNDVSERLTNIDVKNINFDNDTNKNIGKSIYEYFTLVNDNNNYDKMYDYMFSYDGNMDYSDLVKNECGDLLHPTYGSNIYTVKNYLVGNYKHSLPGMNGVINKNNTEVHRITPEKFSNDNIDNNYQNINDIYIIPLFLLKNNTNVPKNKTTDPFIEKYKNHYLSNKDINNIRNNDSFICPKIIDMSSNDTPSFYSANFLNHITLNKITKTISTLKIGTPVGLINRIKSKEMFSRLDEKMFLSYTNGDYIINCDNPLLVGVNDNLSVFNKNYTSMNIFDTNVRVTLIHSNQLCDTDGSNYINTIQYKSQILFSNIIKSIIGKILTVIGIYDINDYKNNKPWRTYIMDTTRITIGGSDHINDVVVRTNIVEYYIRIPLLLKFYKYIFYDISQDDSNVKSKFGVDSSAGNQSVKLLPEFDYPFDTLIKHYFIYYTEGYDNNIMFNKTVYENINLIYDYFSKKNNGSDLIKVITRELVKDINQKYGILFHNDLKLYKTRISKLFGIDQDFVTNFDIGESLYDNENILSNDGDTHSNIPSQKYTKFKDSYKNDVSNSLSGFSAKTNYENMSNFRRFIQTVLTESINDSSFSSRYNTYSSFFNIEEYLKDIKNELNNGKMNEEEKILHLSTVIQKNSSNISNIDNNKKAIIYEFIVTPLKQIDNIMNYLSHLRAAFSNEEIKKTSYSVNSNKIVHSKDWVFSRSNLLLPSNSNLLYSAESYTWSLNIDNVNSNDTVTYAKCALYGFIPTFNESEKNVSNLLRNYVPFNEIMVPSPLTFDKLFLENFNPYYKISNKSSDAHHQNINGAELNIMAFSYSTYTVLDIETGKYVNIVIDPSNYFLSKIEDNNKSDRKNYLNKFSNDKFYHNIKNLPIPYDVGFMHNDSKNILYSLNNSMHTQTYNKNSEIINNVKSGNFVYIDSQYHNSNINVYTHNLISQNVYNNKYGLLGNNAADKFYVPRIRIIDNKKMVAAGGLANEYVNIKDDDFSEINIGNNDTWIKGRKASHGILLGDNGVYTNNCLQRFPIPWSEIRTTNFRLMASWTPEDLAPCRLGLHEQPYIKQGKLQNRGYSSTYHIIEYLLTKLFKDCNLFDINTSSSIGSHNQNNSNVFITFNKIDEYIKKQIINCTKFINEIKMTTNSPIIDSCEYYLRTIHSQYNSLFIPGVKDYNEQVGKTTMYDIQSLLNNFLMGTISEKDINHSANGKLLSGIDESCLYIDPCITKSPHESSDSILSSYKNNNAQIAISINKMGARLLTKLVNPLLFSLKQAESFVHKPERLAYLPHQRITGPLNVVDDSHYGKINIEAYSEFSSASTSSIKSSDLLHTEPNLKYCNFYFTNVINEINKIVRILISSATSNRDKKTYSKIIDMFKSQSDLLSNTIDNRFESINTINYLGDYGRTGHGTFFDRSLPFVLYNDVNTDIKKYINGINDTKGINYYTKCDFDKAIPGDSVLDSSLDYFHKYTLSSIDGVSYDKYSSSYISLPPHLGINLDFTLENRSDYGKLFKDTHENLYPSSFYYSEPKKTTNNLYHFRTSFHKKKEVAYGILNPSDDLDINKKTTNWYDIIGKRGLNQPLVNICNIYDKNKVLSLNEAQNEYRKQTGMTDNPAMNNPFIATRTYYDNSGLDFGGTTTATNANNLNTTIKHFSEKSNIDLLNKARNVFSYIYSYGSLQQSNFMYDDISKFKLKPILVKAYKSQAYAFDSYDGNDTVHTNKGSINEIAGKWETNVNDVNGLFNKLVPLNNVDSLQENNYMISIVSELLHGNFSPVIISKTEKNTPHDMKKFIKNRNKLLSEEVDNDYLINRGNYVNGEIDSVRRRDINILREATNSETVHSTKIRGQAGNDITFGNVASILSSVYYNNSIFYNDNNNFKNENFDINNYKLLLNNDINSVPNKLKLTYIQYNDDHLRLGQSIATYNPTISQWDTFQPIQCNENDEIYTSNNNVTADMFTKVSYSRLLADLTSIDSYEQLKFLSSESTLYSLGLSSSYSTPNNEHFGSPLFEYRPTYMYEKSPNKKLYSRLDFSLEPLVISVEKSKYAATNPYDSCLSLEMGGTGFWQLSGHNPIVNDSYAKVIAKYRLNVNDIYDFSMSRLETDAERSILNNKSYPTEILLKSNSFNFTHMGIQNGVLQDIDNADFSRYGSIIINANNSITGISSYPDAYVDINKYKQNSSVLNPVEDGLKKMANEINKSVFNKAYLGHIHNHDEKYKTIYNSKNLKEGKVLPSTLIKTALNTITTCDRRMGPHNTLTKIGEHKKPLYNTYISPDNLFKGGADALSTSTTIHNMLNSLSSNILAIALNTDNEPLAVSLQNTKEIEQGNVLFKSYSSIIKNIIKNVNSQTSDPRNVFMNLGDSSEEVKENLSATVPYLISELENLFSQIKFLYHYSSKNSSLGGIRSIIEINLQQTKRIATVIYNGLQSIKQELKSDFVLGEQFKGQIGDNNVSFSCELYNYLSNCNEMIIRPNGTINEYFSLNNIVKNQGASFFNRLHSIRKLYDKDSLIKLEEFPTANKLLKKLNLSLDKNNNQINKSLIEDIINTCKMLKMTPFEETHVNNFVCFVNNCHSYIKSKGGSKEKVSGGVNSHSSMSNGPRNLIISNETNDTLKSHFKLYAKNTGINSLLFLPNNSPSDNNLTVNDILGNVGFNNDVEYFSKINDIISGFNQNIRLNNNTMKTNNIDVESSKNNIYGNDDKQLMIYNILDLNILPIDINSLTKEIPLFYIFNYSASVDEYFTSALEAFSIDMYINSIVKNNFEKYVDNFRGFISKICSGEYNNIDLHKIINNNKYTYVNPQLSDSSSQWNIEDYNSFKEFNSINSNFNSLNKFNSIINIVNNCYVSGTGHRYGMVESLLDSSKPYPYDYEHPSTKQRYQGVSTNPLANITAYNKNLSYNNNIINNKIKISGDIYNGLENVPSLNNNSVNNQVNLKISTFLDIYYFNFINTNDFIKKTGDDDALMKVILKRKDFDKSKNNILNTPQIFSLSDEYFYDITSLRSLTDFDNKYKTNAERQNSYLASTGLYTSRKHLVGYDTKYSGGNTVTKKNNINNPLEYLNCYVNECYLSGIYNLSHYSNENKDKSFKYTSTLPFNAVNIFNDYSISNINNALPNKNNWMYEITPPDFLVNINNNWNNEINNMDVPNPCYYNSIIMKSDDMDNMDVYKELPTSSYYNLSCVLSDLDSNYITPITKLNKFENPSFIKGVLNNKIGSNETSINKAIEYKCLSSWGIVDPRAINYNGTQKNIHKAVAFINDDKSKVYYNKKIIQLTLDKNKDDAILNKYKDLNKYDDAFFNINKDFILNNSVTKAPTSDMTKYNSIAAPPFEVIDGINVRSYDPDYINGDIFDTVKKSINFTSCMLTNRIPISLDEYKTLPFDYKMTSQYLFLRKENSLASNWNSFTRSPKYHTSSSYNKVKSRCGFNHTLPVVDVKGMPIFSSDIGISGSLDYNVFRNVSNIIFEDGYIENNDNNYKNHLSIVNTTNSFLNFNNGNFADLNVMVSEHVNFIDINVYRKNFYDDMINKEYILDQTFGGTTDDVFYRGYTSDKYNPNYGAEFINNLKVIRNNYSNYPGVKNSSVVPDKFNNETAAPPQLVEKGKINESNRILYNTKLNNDNGGEYKNFSDFMINNYNSNYSYLNETIFEHSKKNIMMKEIDGRVLTPVYKYPYENAKLADEGKINDNDTLFYPKSISIAAKLIKEESSNLSMLDYKTAGFAATNGITSADVLASGGKPNDSRSIHVLSHILYNVNTGGYVPLRHLSLIDIGYNFIRYKITKEHAFTTSKIISGSMLYDTEYHRNDFTGVNERPDSMTNVSGLYRPIHPRIRIKK